MKFCEDQIAELLIELNKRKTNFFIKGDLKTYVKKIVEKSTILTIEEKGVIQAFIAYYDNNLIEKKAFLTMLAVSPEFQNKKLGQRLLNKSIKKLSKSRFETYDLDVLKSNLKAIKFYEKNGFAKIESKNNIIKMRKYLQYEG